MKYIFIIFLFLISCYTIKSYTPVLIIQKDSTCFYQAKTITNKLLYITLYYNNDSFYIGDTALFVKVHNTPGIIECKLIKK